MNLPDGPPGPSRPPAWVLLVALVAVASNLRVVIAGLPPLVDQIGAAHGLSSTWLGVLTTLPVLCMGLVAPLAPRMAAAWGAAASVELAVLLGLVGSALRGLHGVLPLYAGTIVAGIGIAVAGTLLPRLVKELFPPGRSGMVTGIYMFSMMLGATASAALAVPLAQRLGSWQASLASWALVAAVALVAWLPVLRLERREHDALRGTALAAVSHGLPWRSGTAWLVAGYLAVQSTQFYSSLAWVAPAYVDRGWGASDAGYLLSALAGTQMVSGLLGPVLADRFSDRRLLLLPAAGLCVVALLGLWLAPDAAPWLWVMIFGLGQGGAFSVALVLLVDYAGTPTASGRLSAMAFFLSYTLASLGPTATGALRDLTGGFSAVWLGLLALLVLQVTLALQLRPTLQRVH